MQKNIKQKINRNDIFLIIVFIAAALLFLAGYYLFYHRDGVFVEIIVNNKVYKTLPLDKDCTIKIDGYNGGSNTLKIKDGFASIIDADCPDKLCQKQKKIKYKGESLVCLPHRVVVYVISEETSEIDSIAY